MVGFHQFLAILLIGILKFTTGNIPTSASLTAGQSQQSQSINSPAPKGPKLGLTVAGRLKCFLWGPTTTVSDNNVFPLFPFDSENENVGSRDGTGKIISSKNAFIQQAKPAIYATADYHFQKQRWYGVKKFGLLFRWKFARNDDTNDEVNKRTSLVPMTIDLETERSIPSISSFPAETVRLRMGWDPTRKSIPNDNVGISDKFPWVQVGIDAPSSISQDQACSRVSLGLFLPLYDRFELKWTSFFKRKSHVSEEENSFQRQFINSNLHNFKTTDNWWVPEISLDPLGSLSSTSQYNNCICNDRYLLNVKLRLSTKASFLTGSTVNDEDQQAAHIRLDCSVVDQLSSDRGLSGTTTARLETLLIPSEWWVSIKDTTKFALIHEHNIKSKD